MRRFTFFDKEAVTGPEGGDVFPNFAVSVIPMITIILQSFIRI